MYLSYVVLYINSPFFEVMQSQQIIDVGLKKTSLSLIATVFGQENILLVDFEV